MRCRRHETIMNEEKEARWLENGNRRENDVRPVYPGTLSNTVNFGYEAPFCLSDFILAMAQKRATYIRSPA